MYYLVDGYYKATGVEFENLLVKENIGFDDLRDRGVSYFGISKSDLENSKKTEGQDDLDFVVTNFREA